MALAAAVWSATTTPTSYTARSSLIVASNNRAPDQDAVLVQGYVAYFNNDAYKNTLLRSARIDPGVAVTAQAAAASPILVIQATASEAQRARAAAPAAARAFQTDMNRVRDSANAEEIASLRQQLEEIPNNDGPRATELLNAIQELRADRVNMLQELQLAGGVVENTPSVTRNAALGLFGGLLIGMVLALGLGRVTGRRRGVPAEAVQQRRAG